MIDHLHKQVQHSNRAFPIEQGKGGRGSLFFGGGRGAWQSEKLQDIVHILFLSTKGGGWDTVIFTDTHYRSLLFFFFFLSLLVSLCYDLDLFCFACFAQTLFWLLCIHTAISKGGILNSIPLKLYSLCTTRLHKEGSKNRRRRP